MSVSKLCRECLKFTVAVKRGIGCVGKPQSKVKLGKLPCHKYELDPQLISQQDIEPDSLPPSLKDHKPEVVKPLVPGSVLPTDAKKAANFERLALKRLSVLLDGFRKLSNLGNKAVYEWTDEQCDAIVGHARSAVEDLEKKFQK